MSYPILRFPVNYVDVTGPFTGSSPDKHRGVDLGAGQSIIAPCNMNIYESGYNSVIGYFKKARVYNFSQGHDLAMRFIHMDASTANFTGNVSEGAVIGIMGNTGSSSQGLHLHCDCCVIPSSYGEFSFTDSAREEYSVDPLLIFHLKTGQTVNSTTDVNYTILRDVLGKPQVTAIAGNHSVTLTWDDVAGAVSYCIITHDEIHGDNVLENGVTATSFTQSGLTNGVTYTYAVRAWNGSYYSDYTYDDHVSATPQLDTPILTATEGDSEVILTWTEADTAIEYRVYLHNDLTNTNSRIATIPANEFTYTHTGLTNGTTYKYLVIGYDGNAVSPFYDSTYVTATPRIGTPLTTAVAGDSKVTLTWTAVTATEYRVYLHNDSTNTNSRIATLNGSTLTYTHTGLTNGTTYKYLVIGYDGTNLSSFYDTTYATATPRIGTPLTTAVAGDRKVTLTWTAITATEYRVYLHNDSTNTNSRIATLSGSTLTYTHTGLTNGTTYKYLVIGYDGTDLSSFYDTTYVTATPRISMPILTTEAGDRQVTLNWTNVNADEYRVYLCDVSTNINTRIATLSGSTFIYTDTGLTNGSTYTYLVIAYDGTTSSWAANDRKSATPRIGTPLTTAVAGNSKVTLTWTAVTATEYRVYLHNDSTNTNSRIATLSGSTLIYVHTGLTNGNTYKYLVLGYDGTLVCQWNENNYVTATPHN